MAHFVMQVFDTVFASCIQDFSAISLLFQKRNPSESLIVFLQTSPRSHCVEQAFDVLGSGHIQDRLASHDNSAGGSCVPAQLPMSLLPNGNHNFFLLPASQLACRKFTLAAPTLCSVIDSPMARSKIWPPHTPALYVRPAV